MIKIRETWVNATKGYIIGNNDLYEAYTDVLQKLFLSLQREYGRCISKMYIDITDPIEKYPTARKTIGYVFSKRMQYEDTGRYGRKPAFYIQETWVEITGKDLN